MNDSILPLWALAGVGIAAIFPAALMYDLLWGLIGRARLRHYLLEALCDSAATFIALLICYHLGFHGVNLALMGSAAGLLSKGVWMICCGYEGLFTSEPQRVPEWWVYVGTCVLLPIFLADAFSPLIAFLLLGQ